MSGRVANGRYVRLGTIRRLDTLAKREARRTAVLVYLEGEEVVEEDDKEGRRRRRRRRRRKIRKERR